MMEYATLFKLYNLRDSRTETKTQKKQQKHYTGAITETSKITN